LSDRLLTAREVAAVLGFAAGTIVDWAEAAGFPASRSGRLWGFGSRRSSSGSRSSGAARLLPVGRRRSS